MLFLSVFAGAFAGSAAAHDHGAEYDEVLNDGGLYWQAQTLQFDDGTVSDGDTLTLRKVTDDGNEFVGEYGADSDGNVKINTDDRSGEFFLENSAGTELARFEVAEQTFSTEVDNTTVYNKDDVPQNVADFTFDSNRAGYDLVVESSDLDIEDMETIFSDADYEVRTDDDNDDYFVLQLSGNEETVQGNFSSLNTGDYEFVFTVEDTGLEQSTTLEVADPGDKNAQFDQNVYEEDRGDIVSFNVTLENTDKAEVQFGDEDISGYSHNVSISDASDDTVKLNFNTTEAGDGDGTSPWTLGEDTDATITPGADEETTPKPLEAYGYDLVVSVDGLEKDVSTVEIRERNTEGVTVHTLPSASDYELSDIQENATAADEIANGDYIVVAVEASGVYGSIDNDTTGADLQNGSAFADAHGLEIGLYDNDTGANRDDVAYDVSMATDVVVNEDEDTFYVVFDSNDFTFDDIEDGHRVKANFSMTQASPFIEDEDEADEQSAEDRFDMVERTFEYNGLNDDDVLEVQNSQDAVISGTTTVAENTEVTVNIRSESGASTPFSLSETVTVTEDGMVEAAFDLSEYEAGQEFSASVRGLASTSQDAILVSGGPAELDVTFTVENADGDAVPNATVMVNGEEYTADENGTVTAPLTENSTYSVETSAEGYVDATEDVTVSEDETEFTLTVEEEPTEYTTDVEVVDANGSAVADATVMVNGEEFTTDADGMASVTLDEGDYEFSVSADGYETTTQSETVDSNSTLTVEMTEAMDDSDENMTDEGTDNGTDTSDAENNSSSPSTDSETGGQPGFGVVLALIALVGAALVAHRQA